MSAAGDIQIEKELIAGEQIIKSIESRTDMSETSRKVRVAEIKRLQRQYQWFNSGNGRVMLTIGLANLVIGTLMIIFVSPVWGLFCYLGVAVCIGTYSVGFLASREYISKLRLYTNNTKA